MFHRQWFVKCEEILHREAIGPVWMRDPLVADKVAENLHHLDGDAYRLDAFSIMSNHVHTVFKPLVDPEVLEQIVRAFLKLECGAWHDKLKHIGHLVDAFP